MWDELPEDEAGTAAVGGLEARAAEGASRGSVCGAGPVRWDTIRSSFMHLTVSPVVPAWSTAGQLSVNVLCRRVALNELVVQERLVGPLPQAKWDVSLDRDGQQPTACPKLAAVLLQLTTASLYRSCRAAATVERVLLPS